MASQPTQNKIKIPQRILFCSFYKQAHFHHRSFVLEISSAQNSLSPYFHMVSSCHQKLGLNNTSERFSLTRLISFSTTLPYFHYIICRAPITTWVWFGFFCFYFCFSLFALSLYQNVNTSNRDFVLFVELSEHPVQLLSKMLNTEQVITKCFNLVVFVTVFHVIYFFENPKQSQITQQVPNNY